MIANVTDFIQQFNKQEVNIRWFTFYTIRLLSVLPTKIFPNRSTAFALLRGTLLYPKATYWYLSGTY